LQVAEQFRRQVVLQDINLPAQEFQDPHGRIDDAQELDALPVVKAHEPQPPRFRPALEAERPVPTGSVETAPGGDAVRRQDADDEVAGEERVGAIEIKVQGIVVHDLDVPDQLQGTAVWRGMRRVEDVPVCRRHIAGGQRPAVVKRRAPGSEMKAVVIPGQTFPFGQRRHRAGTLIEVDQPLVEQAVDARRGGVGGVARVEADRLAGEPEAMTSSAGRVQAVSASTVRIRPAVRRSPSINNRFYAEAQS
jgi:hypothetical protein